MRIRGRRISGLALTITALVVVAAVVIGFFVWRGEPVLGQSFSIAYVDLGKALDGHPRRASSERALQEFLAAKQREFASRARTMTPAQRQELDRQIQEQFVRRREELLSGLDKDIRAAVDKVAKDRGFTIVLERSAVLFGGTDLTDAVIEQVGRSK
ncbi:MAG TPA: OmpH family outer membrane protein [bacterium]|jgi:outer membrane protein|nr:OmpH family outer membrane protein [bacterium]